MQVPTGHFTILRKVTPLRNVQRNNVVDDVLTCMVQTQRIYAGGSLPEGVTGAAGDPRGAEVAPAAWG